MSNVTSKTSRTVLQVFFCDDAKIYSLNFKFYGILNAVQQYFVKFNAFFLFSAMKFAKIKSHEIWLRQNREINYARN